MSGKRVWGALVGLAALWSVTGRAEAQAAPPTPSVATPLTVAPDRNGLNLTTGMLTMAAPRLSAPGDPRLTFSRVQDVSPYVVGNLSSGSADSTANYSYSVHTGGSSSDSFSCPDYDCTSQTGNGAQFVANSRIYQEAQSNTVWYFDVAQSVATTTNHTEMYYASKAYYADGEVITYTYDETDYIGAGGMTITSRRPVRVQSNTGYYLTISYQSSGSVATPGYALPLQVSMYSPADASNPIGQLTYSSDGQTITDIAGRVFHCNGCNNSLGNQVESAGGTMQLPGESGTELSATSTGNNPVSTITRDGVQWSYSYTNPYYDSYTRNYGFSGITATGPAGFAMTYGIKATGYNSTLQQFVSSAKDALNRTTTYTYNYLHQLIQITHPEGDIDQLTYDINGNITMATKKAKPNSGLADLGPRLTTTKLRVRGG